MTQAASKGKMTDSWTIPLDDKLQYSEPIPTYYKEHHQWDIDLVSAPDCPDHTNVIRLIKTAPFNFAFRTESSRLEQSFESNHWNRVFDSVKDII